MVKASRSSEHDLSSENLQEASHPSDALQEASHPSDALQDASHPSDALQDASHPSDALQEASHPSDALQDASHPSDALQDASHPSDTIPTEDLAAELLHSNDSCSPSISNSMADNIESSYETSAAIDPPCDSSNVTLTSFVPDVSEPPITSGLSNVKQSQLPSAVTPILTKHLVERLVSLSKPANKIGKKRNRPLSCGVYALTSKRWRELREAEEQEKLLKKSKKGKAKKEKGGKGMVASKKKGGKERVEKQKNDSDWECIVCMSSFYQDEEKGNDCKFMEVGADSTGVAVGCPSETSEAGKADVCKGCPGRELCLSQGGDAPDQKFIDVRMNAARRRIIVVSGKGDVGRIRIPLSVVMVTTSICNFLKPVLSTAISMDTVPPQPQVSSRGIVLQYALKCDQKLRDPRTFSAT
ncbi:hypothetical protein EMCRGX_G001566 [Ephydatia muelleri]